jgi:hypothetical protein
LRSFRRLKAFSIRTEQEENNMPKQYKMRMPEN